MRSVIYLALVAFAALVAAQNANPFNNPPGGYNFKAGAPTALSWKPTSKGTVTLKLQSGGQISPSTGKTIAGKSSERIATNPADKTSQHSQLGKLYLDS